MRVSTMYGVTNVVTEVTKGQKSSQRLGKWTETTDWGTRDDWTTDYGTTDHWTGEYDCDWLLHNWK